jgi:oxygen-independent coproporphyrinogen-3 oxidase
MLSLYIHIPFCVTKCHYCGFYSTKYSPDKADEFISALKQEAACNKDLFADRVIETVYIGGGTPSVLSPAQLQDILDFIGRNFPIAEGAEYTMEANPNSLSDDDLSMLRKAGVNRLSLGIQSFSDMTLKFLGRGHSSRQAEAAFRIARSAGFDNISIDLIYGIPGQTEADWRESVMRALALRPEHISFYSLSLDPGSKFSQEANDGRLSLPEDELVAAQYEVAAGEVKRAGYEHYEISNFSLPGFSCRHNTNYWKRGDYLGLGPAAWSFIKNRRYHAVADLKEYCRRVNTGQSVVDNEEFPDAGQAANEMIMLFLRTDGGLDLQRYRREHGPARAAQLLDNAARFEGSGLLSQAEGRLKLTDKGFFVANAVLERLIE